MQFFFFLFISSTAALFGCVFLRFQFKPLRELMPQRGELQSEGTAFFFGVIANVLGIGLYEALVSLKRPAYTALTLTLTPVSMRTILLGAAIGTIGFISIRMIMRRRRGYPLRRGSIVSLTRAAFVALTVALALELSIFNLRHYDMLLRTDITPTTVTRGSFELAGLTFDEETQQYSNIPGYDGAPRLTVRFDPIKVHTIQLNFSTDRTVLYATKININDEAHRQTDATYPVRLTSALPRSLFIPVHTVGESDRIQLIFEGFDGLQRLFFRLDDVTLNAPLKFSLEPSRLLFLFALLFFLMLTSPKGCLSRIRFDPSSPFQKTAVSLMIAILFFGICWTTVSTYDLRKYQAGGIRAGITQLVSERFFIYFELTDALLAGQLHLHPEPPSALTYLGESAYDDSVRKAEKIKVLWDHVYFDGKYYSYFGIIPVILIFLPFKFITGVHIPVEAVFLIFAFVTILGLRKLLTLIFREYFPDITFDIFLLSFASLVAAAQIPWLAKRTYMYEVAVISGIAFSVWAVAFMFQGIRQFQRSFDDAKSSGIGTKAFFGAGLCAGFAVGCRPNTIFILVWLAILGWRIKPLLRFIPKRDLIRSFLSFALPISFIALLLMAYNFARFGSITEFGFTYQLSFPNAYIAPWRISPLGMIFSTLAYLFQPLSVSFEFPYIALSQLRYPPYVGFIPSEPDFAGLFAFPFFWSLGLLFLPIRKKLLFRETREIIIGALVTTALILMTTVTVGIYYRYLVDFAWVAAIAALMIWLLWIEYPRAELNRDAAKRLFVFVAALMIVTGLCLAMTGPGSYFSKENPLLFERLRYLFSFWL